MLRHTTALALAAGALAALPATSHAATITTNGADVLFSAKSGERNNVRVFLQNSALMIQDSGAPLSASGRCRITAPGLATCGTSGTEFLKVRLGDKDDVAEMTVPKLVAQFQGDDGQDTFFANVKTTPSRTAYHGGFGLDVVDYNGTTSGIDVDLDNVADDGRTGTNDIDNVGPTTESIRGSIFDDVLIGDEGNNIIEGRAGNDTLVGGEGIDRFAEGPGANGADRMFGGGGENDQVDYRERTGGVNVSLDDRAGDGAPGEGDDVRADVEHAAGGSGSDTLTGSASSNLLEGGTGIDTLAGLGANDYLIVSDGKGDDTVGCGEGDRDFVQNDTGDILGRDCEGRTTTTAVGVFSMPARFTARPGRTSALTMRWTHPVRWDRVDEVTIRLSDRGRTVGRITVEQETGTVRASGAIEVAGASRVTGRGDERTMTARLPIRVSERLAGRTLTAQIGATEDGGRRQALKTAGRIRVLAR